jgi:hypothetical protein
VRRALTMTIGLLHWSEQSDADGLEALVDQEHTANEADLLEQQLGVLPDEDIDDPEIVDIFEADPADVQEQRASLPDEDENDR